MHSSLQLIAAPFTPFDQAGRLDLSILPLYADKLVQDGVAGVFMAGTTGEGLSLGKQERFLLAEEWRKVTQGKLSLIVHVGHTCLQTACDLAEHAQSLGVDAIASIGPTFYAPASPRTLARLCARIAASAPATPFYYYHMPSMSRAGHAASSYLRELASLIPNFTGIKFTHDDLPDFRRCLDLAGDRYQIFFGRDELLLPGLVTGARAAVGSTYNFAAPLYAAIHRSLSLGHLKEAASLQALCAEAINIMIRFNGLSGIRATLALCGIDCGSPRLPLDPLTQPQITELEKNLNQIGYLSKLAQLRNVPPC